MTERAAIIKDNCHSYSDIEGDNSLKAAVKYLNENETFKSITGGFIMDENCTKIVSAMPSFAGVQNSAAKDGKQNIRLVATINDSLAYSKVGYRVSISCDDRSMDEQTISCAYVYYTVTGSADGVTEEYSAASLGGTYIYALTLQNVPVGGNVELHITPFAIANDDNGGTTFEQDSITVIYHNGEFQELKKN